ncbi:MAG: O-antigen ligase family protein [Planctomycetota bacterium]|jgi:O-antigen ligase
MTKPQPNPDSTKSEGLILLEYGLFAVCLCAWVARILIIEGPNTQVVSKPANIGTSVYSLLVSAVLLLSFVFWFLWRFFSSRFHYRFTAVEFGVALFCLAAAVAGLGAADKRAAITDTVVLAAAMVMALLFIQILDSPSKLKLLLYFIVVLGALSALYCAAQFLWINRLGIEQYEAAPNLTLQKLGIEPGSFQQMLFEHMLYSKDNRAFFTTGNSAASFMLLAFFCTVALLAQKVQSRQSGPPHPLRLLILTLLALACLSGLFITRSKGAIAALFLASIIFAAYLLFADWLNSHRITLLLACLLLGMAGIGFAAWYGLSHGRLPGGNSMLVRWQYWHASARMYADYPLTGVGPGNFAGYYPSYKPAAAIETVADPHNFILAILAQYGPLGLLGFLGAALTPLALMIFRKRPNSPDSNQSTPSRDFVPAALSCGVIGFLLHNCLDFAIFEPGIHTTFWAIIACLAALHFRKRSLPQLTLRIPFFLKAGAAALAAASIWLYFAHVLTPVAESTSKIQTAQQPASYGRFELAHSLLADATEHDRLSSTAPSMNARLRLSSTAPSMNARLYLHEFELTGRKDPTLLTAARDALLTAAGRNPADYKNFDRLTEVYTLLAQTAADREKADWLNQAFHTASRAVRLYPGSGRLRLRLAEIAEQLGKADFALDQYKKAVEIEDSYRGQFRLMYPGREMFSRLGDQEYQHAKQRIEQLAKFSSP